MVRQVTWLYHFNTWHPFCMVFSCSVFRWLLYIKILMLSWNWFEPVLFLPHLQRPSLRLSSPTWGHPLRWTLQMPGRRQTWCRHQERRSSGKNAHRFASRRQICNDAIFSDDASVMTQRLAMSQESATSKIVTVNPQYGTFHTWDAN